MALIVHPYSDIFVRYLLGDENNKDLLLSFINAVNENYELPQITSIEIKNPFNLKTFTNERESVIDLKAVDENKRQYDIEVQIAGNESFILRALYYWAKLYISQISTGDKFQKLKPTICINLLNFEIFEQLKYKIHSLFLLMEMSNPKYILTDHLMIHFLELPKFFKDRDFQSKFEKWMAFFKYEGKREAIMETLIKDDAIFTKAHEKYKAFTQDEALMDLYESRMKWHFQYNTDIADAEERGIKRGLEQGVKLTILEVIEMDLELKFGDNSLRYMEKIRQIHDTQKLRDIMRLIKRMTNLTELDQALNISQ